MTHKYKLLAIAQAIALLGLIAPFVSPQSSEQQGGRPRDIRSEYFTQNRPSSSAPADEPRRSEPVRKQMKPTSQSARKTSPRHPQYHLAKRIPSIRRERPGNRPAGGGGRVEIGKKRPLPPPTSILEELTGVTFWRLRLAGLGDLGPTITVRGASGTQESWTPIRVASDYLFQVGDMVRLTIESPRTGYLYVIDREQYRDGSLGDPMLIFPTMGTRSGDNQVAAGYLVDLPSATDRVPYFKLTSPRADYVGEVLTIIIARQPLPGLRIAARPLKLGRELVESWENTWGEDVDLYEVDSGVGDRLTDAEQRATHPRSRQLTQEEPVPQTLFRIVNAKIENPLLFNISLRASVR